MWGRDSPDTPEKPHKCTIEKEPCTIGRKFWFFDNGGYTITGISGREKKRPTIDEFVEAFAGRSIYSVEDLYSGYNYAESSRPNADVYPSARGDKLGNAHGECDE